MPVDLHGASGISKTELVRQFTLRATRDALVIRGQCRLDESVPYQALDQGLASRRRAAG